jgi:mRNA-degrading endonuclease RelE of RelBE toxin-antitoxin system
MGDVKRATVYFDPSLHKALRVKAARVLYSFDGTETTVVIVKIGHRREVYR